MFKKQTGGFFAVVLREWKRMTTKPIYVFMVFLAPLIVIVFFSTLLHDGLPHELPVGIVDLDKTTVSRNIIRNVDAGQAIRLQSYSSYGEAKDAMQRGETYAFMLIPDNFSAKLMRGEQPEIPYYTQYAYYLCGSLAMRDLNMGLKTISGGINLRQRTARGESYQEAMAQVQPIAMDFHSIANPTTNYSFYLSSVLMPGVIFLLVIVATVYAVGSEMKERTSARWLVIANGSLFKGLVGKLLPYTVFFTLVLFLADEVMLHILGFPFLGNYIWMFVSSLLSVMAYQAVGVFILAALPVMNTALGIAAFYAVLGLGFCGITYPVEAMLPAVQSFSLLYPARFYYLIYAGMQLNGLSFVQDWQPFFFYLLFLLLPFLLHRRLKTFCVHPIG